MDCSICYEAINESTGCTKLSCSHSFHFSCISSWFLKQEAGSCPLCRKSMDKIEDLPREFTYVEEEDEEEDDDEEDDDEEDEEDEDEEDDDDEERLTFTYEQLNSLLRERGGTGLSASLVNDAFIYTQVNLECLFLGNGARPLCDWEWDDRIDERLTITTQQTSDNTWITTVNRTPWHLMVNGQWQTNVMNPEEDTGIAASAPPAKANAAIEKIQSVWRGFLVRKN